MKSTCHIKDVFLKSSKQVDSPQLKQNDTLVTDTKEKSTVHNAQFQSVFMTKAPLSLARLCTLKIQDMADSGEIDSDPPRWNA